MIETIDTIQTGLDDELLRTRVEMEVSEKLHNYSIGTFYLKEAVTPFCLVRIMCNYFGQYEIHYFLDAYFTHMVKLENANKFLRDIYQFTSGGKGPFIYFNSFYLDCQSHFYSMHSNAKADRIRYKIIEVEPI